MVLQELGVRTAQALAAQLQDEYPDQVLVPRHDPDGFGVLSRIPLTAIRDPEYAGDHGAGAINRGDVQGPQFPAHLPKPHQANSTIRRNHH